MTTIGKAEEALGDLAGPLIGPRHPDYDAARRVYNAMIDKSTALIAQVWTQADVALAVCRATARSAPGRPGRRPQWRCARYLRRRAGYRPGRSPLLRGGPGSKTVTVGGGCTWGQVFQSTGSRFASPAVQVSDRTDLTWHSSSAFTMSNGSRCARSRTPTQPTQPAPRTSIQVVP
jgi:hypothetical protein